jgi:hypothetical protein
MSEKQKGTTDAYREGHERIFGKHTQGSLDTRKVKGALERDEQWYVDNPTYSDADVVREQMGATNPQTGALLIDEKHHQHVNSDAYRENFNHIKWKKKK